MNDAPTPDAFATLNALIKLAADPAAFRTRLAKLQKLLEQTAAAEQRLAERSAAFDQKVATEKAALDERKAKLNARELELMRREHLAEKTLERERSDRIGRSRPLSEAASISQEQA
jgi:hypothetical protein